MFSTNHMSLKKKWSKKTHSSTQNKNDGFSGRMVGEEVDAIVWRSAIISGIIANAKYTIKSSRLAAIFRVISRFSCLHFTMIQTCTYLYSSDYSPQRRPSWIYQQIGNRSHVTLLILSAKICKQCLRVKSLKQLCPTEVYYWA